MGNKKAPHKPNKPAKNTSTAKAPLKSPADQTKAAAVPAKKAKTDKDAVKAKTPSAVKPALPKNSAAEKKSAVEVKTPPKGSTKTAVETAVKSSPNSPLKAASPSRAAGDKKKSKAVAPEAPSAASAASAASAKAGRKGKDKPRIHTPEIQEKIRDLIKLAKEQEYLTYDDINEILPNNIVDPNDVESIMEQLRSMEFDIIDASEVDRYKDRRSDESDLDDDDSKGEQKLDILDDPVRMYLKQMGQVPLLTREQEVEISKRIEDAEIEVSRHLHMFGFMHADYMDMADKLIKGKERFDRVILDKKIESRERYMKGLPRLCEQLKQMHAENDDLFRHITAEKMKVGMGKGRLISSPARHDGAFVEQ